MSDFRTLQLNVEQLAFLYEVLSNPNIVVPVSKSRVAADVFQMIEHARGQQQ